MAMKRLRVTAALAAHAALAFATELNGPLSTALSAAQFLNSGTVSSTDTYAYMPIACMYLEPENVTSAQASWGEGGTCPYLYEVTGPMPPQGSCNASAPTPGYDRMGGDYKTLMLQNDDWQQCQQTCCNDTQCVAWVYAPTAPSNFMSCNQGSHCCYLKGSSPNPTNSTIPGITSGSMAHALPTVTTPPVGMRSAVPLGGLGAGALELRADGTFHEVTIENASPAGQAKHGVLADALLALRVNPQGGPAVTRAVRTHPPAYAVDAGLDSITYSGTYPLSRLQLASSDLASAGVSAALYAYSPLKPNDIQYSSAPAAAFTLSLTNSKSTASDVSLLLSLPWGGVNDCARPLVNGMASSVYAGAGDASSCMRACAAAPASNCSSWTFDSTAPAGKGCSLSNGVGWSVYRQGQTCGVRGSWSAPSTASGLTYSQADALGRPGPSNGDITLRPVVDSDGPGPVSVSFGIADGIEDLWAAYQANGTFTQGQGGVTAAPFVNSLGTVGAATVATTVPAGSTVTVTIVLAWYFPHRDHMGQDIGNYYSTIWDSSDDVAAGLASQQALVDMVTSITTHHAVFMGPSNPMPDFIQDLTLNQMSHFRGMIAMRDGRLREFEAFDCPDVDSIHNDYQRHLPYIWLWPQFERSKMEEWGAGQAADGHIWEYLGSFGLGPIDQPGGRIMGDTTTLWIVELYEMWRGTGDFDFLQQWWPTAVRALTWQAGAACVNNGLNQGLPSHLVCTYDIIDFEQYNTTTFNSMLHLLAMKAGGELAQVMGDSATLALTQAAYSAGTTAMQSLLWNSTLGYYRGYTGGDAIMADCLYGVMLGLHHGLGWVNPGQNGTGAAMIQSHLNNELKYNGNTYGLAVVTGRHTPPPMVEDTLPTSRLLRAARDAAARALASPELTSAHGMGPSASQLLGLPTGPARHSFLGHSHGLGSSVDTIDDVDWMGAGPDWSYVAVQLAAAQHREAVGDLHAPLPPSVLTTLLDPANRSMGQYRTGLADLWNIAGINSPADWSARAPVQTEGDVPTVAVTGKVYASGSSSLSVGSPAVVTSSGTPSNLIDGLPYVTSHYGFLLTDYYLVPLLTGQQTDLPGGSLSFSPLYPCPYTLPLVLPGSTGTFSCSPAGGSSNNYTVAMAFGQLSLPAGGLSIAGAVYPGQVNLGPGQSVSWTV